MSVVIEKPECYGHFIRDETTTRNCDTCDHENSCWKEINFSMYKRSANTADDQTNDDASLAVLVAYFTGLVLGGLLGYFVA